MNSKQLWELAHKIPKISQKFKNIYRIDYVHKIKEPGFYIINLDKSTEPGSHWVTLEYNPKNTSIYFDSYGMPPLKELKFF